MKKFVITFTVLMIIFTMTVSGAYAFTANNGTEYPDPTEEMKEEFSYFFMTSSGAFYGLTAPVDQKTGENGTIQFIAVEDGIRQSFQLTTSDTTTAKWIKLGQPAEMKKGEITASIFSGAEIRWASFTIKDENGEIVVEGDPNFFNLPELVQDQMRTKTIPAIMKTMGLLTVCGIGLIALLVGLVVLKKVLYRFLN